MSNKNVSAVCETSESIDVKLVNLSKLVSLNISGDNSEISNDIDPWLLMLTLTWTMAKFLLLYKEEESLIFWNDVWKDKSKIESEKYMKITLDKDR